MRTAFTLIELLVVMIIMTLLMAMIAPSGAKMLRSFQKSVQKTKDIQELSKQRSISFLQAREQNIEIAGKKYHISSKGVISQYEKSNDNY